MRAHNERLVLTLIRQRGPTAKADIARATGLSAQTVSVIMRGLEADGLLLRGTPVRGRVGQPSVPMALAPDGAYFLGLNVGRRSLEMVLIDFTGTVLERRRRTHDYPTPDAVMRFAQETATALRDGLPRDRRGRVTGMGIAMPYLLWDWAEALGAPQAVMDAWRSEDIRAGIAERCGLPVFLQNDATAACGAELVFGPAVEQGSFLHFYLGYFIGGGVVLNHRLYSGHSGNAGALGSIPVPGPAGRPMQLIEVASLSGLESALVAAGHDADGLWAGPEALTADEAVLADWLDAAAPGIAYACASAVAVLDLPVVMIDGWITEELRARLVAAVDRGLDRVNLAGLRRPEVRPGTMGAAARAIGAASLPLSERFLVETTALPALS
ncbi:ROK family transcriptional regulator [Psychromarinibacter sp. C21-152]|uniref:ROK family transcriptional regulator n=2 Tax=Psychromarinibacter sediminicola TaxID=3033385 RepID=A0AAE3TAH9_9RHOB|nr:ROK family transcriptional regulator [Psychromarinibacter sediminicola]MDF0601989.1 ROK family transcriptional regulator [Psychromarinibacter sediminicola]